MEDLLLMLDGVLVDAGKTLSNKSRYDILIALSKGKRTILQIAKETGLSQMTVRFHLKTLVEAGLVRKSSAYKTGGAGRPGAFYELSKSLAMISFPPRQYMLLSYILLASLKESLGELQAKTVLYSFGKKLGQKFRMEIERALMNDNEFTTERFVHYLLDICFKKIGVIAEAVKNSDKEVIIKFYNCPFEEMARNYAGLICEGLENGLYDGLYANSKIFTWKKTKSMIKGDEYCEHMLFLNLGDNKKMLTLQENNINNQKGVKFSMPR
ncbi:MAG: ArsR family transcriptional regulator [Nitrososphaerota archaeon]|nr:ArsR family transcriptional regulator [Aigarchaeota archaeon]MDW8076069.1 ArsR family transcriptional regulator [Nitrososphaerota archaeon]